MFECTSSRLGPILDTVWTVLMTANLAVAAGSSKQDWEDNFDGDPPFSRNVAIPVYIGAALLGGAGMYFGYTRTSACRDAKNDLAIRQMQNRGPAAPPPPGVGTWPPPQPEPTAPAPAPTPPTEPTPVPLQ